jgi:Protein of unknown function (DUF1552)
MTRTPAHVPPNRSRRRFLGALGAGIAVSCLAPELRAERERKGAPLRFIGAYLPHGCAYELWKPDADFNLRRPDSSLAPFDAPETYGKSFKSQLLVIDGLDLAAGIEVGTVGHEAARVILTGSGAQGKGASIDQYLAQDCLLGAETPLTSLVLAVGNDATDIGSNLSYTSLGTPVPKWIDPVRVYDELFGQPLSQLGQAELADQRRRGRSVLDFARRDLARLQRRAALGERAKLEQHGTALRELEKRLSPAARPCNAPSRPDRAQFPKLRAFGGGEPNFEVVTELMTELLARAIACDLTRFATIMLPDLSRTGLYPELPADLHAEVAHRYSPRTEHGPGLPQTWQLLGLQNRHSYGHVARLLQHLDEAGVLGDTIVYATSDMGDPSRHSSRNVPTIVAGGCGGHFTLGRHLDLRRTKGDALFPHNRLLVSVLQAFGVQRDSFGSAPSSRTTTGRLNELVL